MPATSPQPASGEARNDAHAFPPSPSLPRSAAASRPACSSSSPTPSWHRWRGCPPPRALPPCNSINVTIINPLFMTVFMGMAAAVAGACRQGGPRLERGRLGLAARRQPRLSRSAASSSRWSSTCRSTMRSPPPTRLAPKVPPVGALSRRMAAVEPRPHGRLPGCRWRPLPWPFSRRLTHRPDDRVCLRPCAEQDTKKAGMPRPFRTHAWRLPARDGMLDQAGRRGRGRQRRWLQRLRIHADVGEAGDGVDLVDQC